MKITNIEIIEKANQYKDNPIKKLIVYFQVGKSIYGFGCDSNEEAFKYLNDEEVIRAITHPEISISRGYYKGEKV